jgi:hypothetical protein
MQHVWVTVKCPDCVESRVASEDVTLRHCVDDETWSYRFTCPMCRRATVSPTGRPAALEAMLVGCPIESWSLPAELLEVHEGPALTRDEELELHEILDSPAWMDELMSVGREDLPL